MGSHTPSISSSLSKLKARIGTARPAPAPEPEPERPEMTEDEVERMLRYFRVPPRFLKCTFDNFAGGDKIKAILKEKGAWTDSILLYGTTGGGKTHLATAMLRYHLREIAKTTNQVRFTTAPDILLSIRSCFSRNMDELALVNGFADLGYLVIDDLGADKPTDWAIQTFYLILDRRSREELPTFVTSNLSIQSIENQYGARIASRLADMRTINLQMPDYRKRRK